MDACLHVMCAGLILCRSVWLFELCEGVPACGTCRSYVAWDTCCVLHVYMLATGDALGM
jgi:hypothetical protein